MLVVEKIGEFPRKNAKEAGETKCLDCLLLFIIKLLIIVYNLFKQVKLIKVYKNFNDLYICKSITIL